MTEMGTNNIIWTGPHLRTALLVATLDIVAAGIQFFILSGKNPVGVLYYVASGALGPVAMEGGLMPGLVGLASHFIIALSFAFLFFWLVKNFPALLEHTVVLALGYGLFMWAFVRFVIIPFSQVKPGPFRIDRVLINVMILVVCICLPLIMRARQERVINSKINQEKR